MIELRDLWKSYRAGGTRTIVARGLNVEIPTRGSVALLGRNGAGKSTLLRMISGAENPDRGAIIYNGTISWPVAFSGAFHGALTGAQNVRFVARIYGVDSDELIDFVRDFADIGPHFHAPLRTYSTGMRARLAFGMSMGIAFDTYLIDEVVAVGDAAFRARSSALLKERIAVGSAIIVSHSMPLLRELCQSGVVLIDGSARHFDTIEEAIKTHEAAMRGRIPPWAQRKPEPDLRRRQRERAPADPRVEIALGMRHG